MRAFEKSKHLSCGRKRTRRDASGGKHTCLTDDCTHPHVTLLGRDVQRGVSLAVWIRHRRASREQDANDVRVISVRRFEQRNVTESPLHRLRHVIGKLDVEKRLHAFAVAPERGSHERRAITRARVTRHFFLFSQLSFAKVKRMVFIFFLLPCVCQLRR